ncbi:MAG TPA: TetR/AcrR family transcriptional regulator [Burkholderiaceae bacterium]|jgi:AcrR family transcriptional regulator|nr:TetR/AcrR family transcriptional regulator [Burkholderiaceae bacterium]
MSSMEVTPPRPRWERRKEARPAELLAAALDLFVEKGYAGTRLDDVAARAGVSKGTLYLYFQNKEELFKAVVRENIVTPLAEAAQEMREFDGPSAELVRNLITAWWKDFGSTHAGGLTKLLMAESGNFPEIAGFFLAEVIEPWHQLLGSAVARGIRRREFRPVDVALFTRVMTAPLVMLSLWNRSFGACSTQPVDADAFVAMLLDTHLTSLRTTRKNAPRKAAAKTNKRIKGARR